MDDIGRVAVGENAIPVTIDPVETMHGIILVAEGAAAVCVVVRNGDSSGMTQGAELVREVVHVDSAVRAEIVVKNEENVTHARRGL